MTDSTEKRLKHWERQLEEYLWNNEDELESDLRWLRPGGRQMRVNFEKWLGGPENVPPGISIWDPYSHGKKVIDLLGTNREGALVICEVKYKGGCG